MGRELVERFPVARDTFAEADEALGFSISKLIFEGPAEDLKLTENTQPAILTASIATLRVLALHGIEPSLAAGHSLGEWSAHVAAGTISFADAVRSVKARGRAMQLAVPAGQGAMAAIIALSPEQVTEICAEAARETGLTVSAANFNSPGQTVISGALAAVVKASELAKAKGAKRALPLPVSAPFHSALMQPAAERLKEYMQDIAFTAPRIPVINNVDVANIADPARIRDALVRQAYHPVRWSETIRALAAQGITHVAECGPGKVLAGMTKRIDSSLESLALADRSSLEHGVGQLKGA